MKRRAGSFALAAAMALFCAMPAGADDAEFANYLLACRGCHLVDGSGVAPDVPTLRDTLGHIVATPAGRGYLVRVPGVAQSRLNDQELADVLNWVLREFNAETLPAGFRPYTGKEISRLRGQVLADPNGFRRTLPVPQS